MFTNTLVFKIKKEEATIIIDTFSKYKVGLFRLSYLNISDCGLEDNKMYSVTLKCDMKDEQEVLSDLIMLARMGVDIEELWVG